MTSTHRGYQEPHVFTAPHFFFSPPKSSNGHIKCLKLLISNNASIGKNETARTDLFGTDISGEAALVVTCDDSTGERLKKITTFGNDTQSGKMQKR